MSLQDDWTVSDYGQVAPSKSSNVDLRADIREDEGEEGEEIGGLEIDVRLLLFLRIILVGVQTKGFCCCAKIFMYIALPPGAV